MSLSYAPVARRLLTQIKSFDEDCWEWTGSYDNHGYGQISYFGRCTKAYVVSFIVHKGEWPRGKQVMHTCDNRRCINPSHLVLGTLQLNLADMRKKGRHVKGTMFPQAKLSDADVRLVRMSPSRNSELALAFGINQSVISRIRNGKAWKHVH